ncbi:hypothetical protein ACOSQ2_000570 [Xanthoceras sorbifolium]
MNQFQPFLLLSMLLLLISSNLCRALYSNQIGVAYTITVDQSGHGNFTKIQNAIDSIPSRNTNWIRIQISPGKYWEKVTIPVDKPYIFLDGSDSKSTSIEWSDHQSTSASCTFCSDADNIIAKGITFKNNYNIQVDTGRIAPAVAARILGDKSAFYHCAFVGMQDTLWDERGRHYFYKCYIEGGIDFIFGAGQSIYELCEINVNIGRLAPEYPAGFITAQARNSSTETNGYVFKSCTIYGAGKVLLGRAYGGYSRVIFANSTLSDIVVPQGWEAWDYKDKEQNIEYAEVDCSGPGADTSKRVPWVKKLSRTELNQFVDISYIDKEGWISKLPKLL